MQKLSMFLFTTFAKISYLITLFFFSWTALANDGSVVFNKCKSCHNFEKNRLGPHLAGVIGRKAGGVNGYRYSKAMKKAGESGLIWTEFTLDKFLVNPKSFMKRTKMSFAGIKDKKHRKAVIEYLKKNNMLLPT